MPPPALPALTWPFRMLLHGLRAVLGCARYLPTTRRFPAFLIETPHAYGRVPPARSGGRRRPEF